MLMVVMVVGSGYGDGCDVFSDYANGGSGDSDAGVAYVGDTGYGGGGGCGGCGSGFGIDFSVWW